MTQRSFRREVALDTETTGLDKRHDRIIEIACVEIIDLMPTGRTYYTLVNPGNRAIHAEAARIHGITVDKLEGQPHFADIAEEFLAFIGDARLVAHNASFDIEFLSRELERLGRPPLANPYVDTLALAKQKFPTAPNLTLDALCRRFAIDASARVLHGALIDTQLLARVYLELNGGRERSLSFELKTAARPDADIERPFRAPRRLGLPTAAELERHAAFLAGIKNSSWQEDG